MAKKMCPDYATCGASAFGNLLRRKLTSKNGCPKNTNSRCEIIGKPRNKRIKAWVSILEHYGTGERIVYNVRLKKSILCVTPCTILIEAKYLKGEK